MPNQNSYGEFILGVYQAQLVDCAQHYPELTKEFKRDFVRLSSAVKCHGIRFALETMPAFRKHFDKCLEKRRLTSSGLLQFGVTHKGGTIPRLFRGLILRVFDRNGALRDDLDVDAVRLIRQLLGVVRKLRMASSIRDTGKTVQEFYQIDQSIRSSSLNWEDDQAFDQGVANNETSFTDAQRSVDRDQMALPGICPEKLDGSTVDYRLLHTVQQVADWMCSKLGSFDPWLWKPRHGPGAVSDFGFGSYKYDFQTWPERLERIFPYADFAHANYASVKPISVQEATLHGFYHDKPARLCAVPKTLSTPRLIASESTCLQWTQQIIRDFLYNQVSSTCLSSFIDFGRQDKNGALALEASMDGSHATIDLSNASDRISCWHVERLFRRSPSLLRAVQSTRSVWVEQEICRFSPRYHYLRKYSTMGNATTFPVQSLFFLCLALGSVLHTRGLKVSDRIMRRIAGDQVRVFGDDIIIPDDCSGLMVELLQHLELKVNVRKTFTEGNFRESCGVDAFNGHNVTTVNILEVPRRAGPGSIVSSVDVHHNLCDRGFVATATFIQKTASRLVSNKIRFVKHGSGLFGWSSLYGGDNAHLPVRHSRTLHKAEIKCLKLRVTDPRLPAKESAGLLQYFTEAPRVVASAVSTLGYLSRRPKCGITLGWVPLGDPAC